MTFRLVHHTADLAVEFSSSGLAGLLEDAARAVHRMYAGRVDLSSDQRLELTVRSSTGEGLLVAWVNEIIYRVDAEGLLVVDAGPVRVVETAEGIQALASCAVADLSQGHFQAEAVLKAATYHGLELAWRDGRLRATLVVDT